MFRIVSIEFHIVIIVKLFKIISPVIHPYLQGGLWKLLLFQAVGATEVFNSIGTNFVTLICTLYFNITLGMNLPDSTSILQIGI